MVEPYPHLIQIETIVACNSHCKMCGMRQMTRAGGKMTWELFRKIVAECRDLGIDFVCPFINGDPLCDDRMVAMLRYLKAKMPSVTIGWFTNGLLLTADLLQKLAPFVRIFNISIHGGNKSTYETVTGCVWEQALEKLDLLIAVNKELGEPFEINAQMADFSLTHDSIADFNALCQARGITPNVCCFSNFGGLIKDTVGEAPFADWPYKLCARSQWHIYILWNGDAVSCCFDVNGVNTFGNVKRSSLKDIWESAAYREFRQKHRDGKYKEIPVCRDCNSNRFNG